MMQINLDGSKILTTVIVGAIVGGFTFMWSMNARVATLEANQSIVDRVETLENALMPVLIEFKLQKEIEKMALKAIEENEGPTPPIVVDDPVRPLDYLDRKRAKDALRGSAEDWAREQMPVRKK